MKNSSWVGREVKVLLGGVERGVNMIINTVFNFQRINRKLIFLKDYVVTINSMSTVIAAGILQ